MTYTVLKKGSLEEPKVHLFCSKCGFEGLGIESDKTTIHDKSMDRHYSVWICPTKDCNNYLQEID